MRILDTEGNEITRNAADLSVGTLHTERIIREDAEPIDNEKKFAWADEDYEEILRYEEFTKEEVRERRIELLKRKLAGSDYCVTKIAEGAATREEYSSVLAQRQVWREEINILESEA